MVYKDISGQTFGRLTVLRFDKKDAQGRSLWLCRCSCGSSTIAQGYKLSSGHTRSCGCLARERSSQRRRKDLTGRIFGKLTVIRFTELNKHGSQKWLCKCECGNYATPTTASLCGGKAKSCGCFKPGHVTHGLSHLPEYRIWSGIKRRCYNRSDGNYKNYGGRGIRVCDRWMSGFQFFYQDMGPRPQKDYSIERLDNDGDYSPGNCIWATRIQQSKNKRAQYWSKIITYKGQSRTIPEWARELGVRYTTIKSRIDRGWSHEAALTTPVREKKRPTK